MKSSVGINTHGRAPAHIQRDVDTLKQIIRSGLLSSEASLQLQGAVKVLEENMANAKTMANDYDYRLTCWEFIRDVPGRVDA